MENFKNELKNLFDEESFVGEFVYKMICQSKFCLADSDYICDNIADMSDSELTHEKIKEELSAIKRCNSRIYRYLDLYFFLKNSFQDSELKEETFEINNFIEEISRNCTEYTKMKFPVKKKLSENAYIKVNKSYTIFIILMQVRNALIKGAKTVNFSCNISDGYFNLSIKFKKSKKENDFIVLEDDAMQSFFNEISEFLAKKINSEVSDYDDGADIKIPVYEKLELHSSEKEYGKNKNRELYYYSIMLSEFSEYNFYD